MEEGIPHSVGCTGQLWLRKQSQENSNMADESPHSGQGHAVLQKNKERGQVQLQGRVTCVVTQGRRLTGAPPLV